MYVINGGCHGDGRCLETAAATREYTITSRTRNEKVMNASLKPLIDYYPLYTALLSDWHVSDSSHLAYLRERTCEVDIGAFLHCNDSKICFVRLAYGIAKAGE